MDEKKYEEVPVELQTHNPSDYKSPAPSQSNPESGSEVPANLMVNQPQKYSKTQAAFSPNTVGLIGGALTGTLATAAQKTKSAADWADKKFAVHPGIQNYIDSQVGSDFNLTAKELSKITGMPVETQSQAQQAIKKISGAQATSPQIKPVYEMVNGVPTITSYEHIPGSPAIDPLDLSPYKKTPGYHFKKHGELPLRSAVAGYDIAKGLQQLDSPAGYGDIAAGVSMGAAPFLPKSVKGVPVRAVATGLGLLPVGAEMVSPASAADVSGTAFDVATGLMGPAGMMLTPSELGAGTVQRKREVYRPGMKVLEGSTLPPEQRAHGGLVHLAEGGESNTGPFIGYPHIKNKPRDPNFKQQTGPVLGALDAMLGVQRDDVSMLTPEGQAYRNMYEKVEPYGIASNVLPVMGGPLKAIGKTAARELGPTAANMAENYLTKIGGIQYAVPPSKGGDVIKASEALGKHENKYLGLTQTDNMGIHDGRQGGNRFPTLQQTSSVHAKDKPVWAMDSEKHAERLIDAAQDPNLIFSTYIGRPDQLKSNKTVFNDVLQNHYARTLTPEQIDLINNRIATVKDAKGRLIFPQSFDIRDKFATQELGGDTFARRGKMADILGLGEGVGKTRGGIALPQYEDILRSHRDPLTEGVPTSSIGTQLFNVDPNKPTFRTDKYHTDYQYPVFGENTGVTFSPFPHSMLDWHEAQIKKTNQVPHGNAWFNYMQTPQHINENFLTRLQKEGFAEGGAIRGYQVGGKIARLASDLILPAAENAARTQIIGTLPTYGKAAEALAARGAQGRAIDFGAGLGEGAKLLGKDVDTYEPFARNWNPTFTRPEDIPTDAYGRLTNLNVLNVVPRESRDEIVQHIGRVMEPGGMGIVTTRGADVMKAQGRVGPEPMSIITSRDTYQKGFTKQELEDYMKYMLGNKFDVNKFNLGPAGVMIQKKADGGSMLPTASLDVRSMPSISGMPGVGYMQTPQGSMARLQMEKDLENARLRAGVSGMAMAIPGQHGVKMMPGQMDIGANVPIGRGNLDISARRTINPIPGRGHMQGINAQYTMPFKKGGPAIKHTIKTLPAGLSKAEFKHMLDNGHIIVPKK